MGSIPGYEFLPDSKSPDLHLIHPTAGERHSIWTNVSSSWKDSLTVPLFLAESLYLSIVPLARDGGMTNWALVDKNLPPDGRPILCSCESFRKRSLTSDSHGNVSESIVHGIASVFCPREQRGRGYAARLMIEMAKILHGWQLRDKKCIGSILYSDIGKTYYAKLGWHPNPSNFHLTFQPSKTANTIKQEASKPILEEELAELCKRDEDMIKKALAIPAPGVQTRLSIVPDLDHMLWHISKESFASCILFENVPHAKGAIAGPPGSRVWAVWTHRYYSPVDAESHDNTLYVLRLVFEDQDMRNNFSSTDIEVSDSKRIEQLGYLKAIIHAAQAEAVDWKLDYVKLWNPMPVIQGMIKEIGIEHNFVERKNESIASGLWYDENGEQGAAPQWMNNEHYSWC